MNFSSVRCGEVARFGLSSRSALMVSVRLFVSVFVGVSNLPSAVALVMGGRSFRAVCRLNLEFLQFLA